MNKNPIICAIDKADLESAKTLITEISPYIGMVKLGLEFFCKFGSQGVKEIEKLNLPIFLDLKLHDIPNTVSQAIKSLMDLNLSIITIHTAGGSEMMKRTAQTLAEESIKLNKAKPILVGVTILTSLSEDEVNKIGFSGSIEKNVFNLARLAQESNLDGIVCSPLEIETIRKNLGGNFKLIVPGIRTSLDQSDDQKRVLTPKEALNKGADYLVIGRPITANNDPKLAAKSILNSLNH